jgi:hypothetical protein
MPDDTEHPRTPELPATVERTTRLSRSNGVAVPLYRTAEEEIEANRRDHAKEFARELTEEQRAVRDADLRARGFRVRYAPRAVE